MDFVLICDTPREKPLFYIPKVFGKTTIQQIRPQHTVHLSYINLFKTKYSMTKVTVNKTIQVPASKAWAKLSSFRNIEEISPIIVKSETIGEGVGATRICYMPDGAAAAIHETLHKVEDTTMELQYTMTKGPFPISGYVSDIKVEAIGDSSCKVTWGCQFETEEEARNNSAMIELFEGFYHAIIEGLETRIQDKHKLQKQKRFILDLFWTGFFVLFPTFGKLMS